MSEVPNIPNLPGVVRARLGKTVPAGSHPDADLLAAFAENSLPTGEREQTLAHLSACAECREIVSLALPQDFLVAASAVGEPAPKRVSWYFLRWGGAVATACVIVTAVITLRPQDAMKQPEPQSVMVKSEQPEVSSSVAPDTAKNHSTATFPVRANTEADETKLGAAAAKPSEAPAPLKKDAPQSRDQLADLRMGPSGERADQKSSAKRDEPRSAGAGAGTSSPAVGFGDLSSQSQPSPTSPPPPQAATANTAVAQKAKEENKTVEVQAQADEVAAADTSARKQQQQPLDATTMSRVVNRQRTAKSAKKAEGVQDSSATNEYALKTAEDSEVKGGVMRESEVSARIVNGKLQVDKNMDGRWALSTLSSSFAPGAELSAFSTVGDSIWAGGKGGALFVSTDSGKSWQSVKGDWKGDIVAITRRDATNGEFTTSSGETWFTDNGGRSWKRK